MLRRLLPPVLVDAVNWLIRGPHRIALQRYVRGRIVAGSLPYALYKRRFLIRALSDPTLLERFRCGEHLPVGYGVGIDERCVEYPWLFSRLTQSAERLLDAGSVLNFDFLLSQPVLNGKTIHILTLAPENACYWTRGISYLFADLRDIPVRDLYYDTIVCLSTIEHVGSDNARYTGSQRSSEHRPEDFLLALRELQRVLKPGGRLLLTVPYGRYEHHGWLQQFDRALLESAVSALSEAGRVAVAFFRYTARGWNAADAEACADCQYVDLPTLAPDGRYERIPPEPDFAAAARAVACLEFTKY